MNRRLLTGIGAALILTLLLIGIAAAQVSTNFDLSWSALTGGGDTRVSTNNTLHDSFGQWLAGASESDHALVQVTFWPGAVAPARPVLAAALSSRNALLSWAANGWNPHWQVRRATTPYFETTSGDPAGDDTTENCATDRDTVTCTDKGTIGDPANNYFYLVRAYNSDGASMDSNRVGEFDFGLQRGNP